MLDPSEFESWDSYCLPSEYKLAPLVYTKKKMVVTLGEIEKSKLPSIVWKQKSMLLEENEGVASNNEAEADDDQDREADKEKQEKQSIKMLVQQKEMENGWTHVNLILYSNQSTKSILPSKAAMVGDVIYLSNVHGQFNQLMKVIMFKEEIGMRNPNHSIADFKTGQPAWTFKLFTDCQEFKRFGEEKSPISIDRLNHSWVTKLNLNRLSKKKRAQAQTNREHYTDCLQINFAEFAVIFNVSFDERKGAALGDLYVEELD